MHMTHNKKGCVKQLARAQKQSQLEQVEQNQVNFFCILKAKVLVCEKNFS